MRKILPYYFTIEVLCLLLYGWCASTWLDWKRLGADAFPGSPDAAWLYSRTYEHYVWAGGLITGVAIGGAVAAIILQIRLSGNIAIRTRLLQLAVVVLPAAALITGNSLESSIPWPTVKTGVLQ